MEFLSADKSFRADSEVKGALRCGLVGASVTSWGIFGYGGVWVRVPDVDFSLLLSGPSQGKGKEGG